MKKFLLLFLSLLMLSCSTTNTPSVNGKTNDGLTAKGQKAEFFAFQVDEHIYLAVNSADINFIFTTDTKDISYSDLGSTIIIITDNKNIYQVNAVEITDFYNGTNADNKKSLLQLYYNWEKDYQEENRDVIFDNKKYSISNKNENEILKWSYSPKEVGTDPNKVKETLGVSFVYKNYIVTVQMNITNGDIEADKLKEYNELHNKIILFDKKVDNTSIREYFNL